MTDGIAFVVCGEKAEQEYSGAVASIGQSENTYPIQRFGRDYGAVNKTASRRLKVTLYDNCQFDRWIYTDADTRVHGDLSPLFAILDDGWDVVITPSSNQDGDAFWHVGDREAGDTMREIGTVPLQLQCGVMAVAKNERTRALFDAWMHEWERYSGEDQAAFIRALYSSPVRVWLMGRPWNGGAVISHRFGMCR